MSDTGVIGIIGGSGFYNMAGMTDVRTVDIDTPFGKPSDPPIVGNLGGREVVFIARHGRGHRYNPTSVPSRANIYALKVLGVTHLVSISAVGSMKHQIAPLHFVVPDQLYDRTVARPRSFFDDGLVVHVAFAEPYCPDLRRALISAAESTGATVHREGTYICIEGPQFSTFAESEVYRGWGMSIIGMTALPEARLAREAEMCYATLAMVTDYDTWHPDHENVTVDMVVSNLKHNVQRAKDTVAALVPAIGASRECTCGNALDNSVMSDKSVVPPQIKEQLSPLLKRVWG